MRRRHAAASLAVAAVMGVLTLGRLFPTEKMFAAAGAVPVVSSRWQYAQLVADSNGARFASADGAATNDAAVVGKPPRQGRTTPTIELFTVLGGTGHFQGIYSLLDLIGAKGWELVTVQRAGDGDTYIFKRPA